MNCKIVCCCCECIHRFEVIDEEERGAVKTICFACLANSESEGVATRIPEHAHCDDWTPRPHHCPKCGNLTNLRFDGEEA